MRSKHSITDCTNSVNESLKMVGKRKLSTRFRNDEAIKPPKSFPTEELRQPTSTVKRGLPTRLDEQQPLPTTHQANVAKLTPNDYQSIAERLVYLLIQRWAFYADYHSSGVLLASLQRSRNEWLLDSVFERYWTKPSRKRLQSDLRNPLKESMVRIGPCVLTIEPHVFEVTLYAIREPQAQTPQTPESQSRQRSGLPYAPENPGSGRSYIPQGEPSPLNTLSSIPNQSLGQVKANARKGLHGDMRQYQAIPQQPSSASKPMVQPASEIFPSNVPKQSASQPPKQSPDPVIQMLASRAATDNDLKGLMKTVASGNASSEELKVFQAHIDELTASLQSQTEIARGISNGRTLAPAPGELVPASNQLPQGSLPKGAADPHTARPPKSNDSPTPYLQGGVMTTEHPVAHRYNRPSQKLVPRSEGPLISAKSETIAVALEFAGSGDRFLFPRYSMLDFSTDGTQVIASFLIVRKGSERDSETYTQVIDYHQSVTVRLSTLSAKILDPLARVTASPLETRKYMNGVIDSTRQAKNAYLAIHLPRDSQGMKEGMEKQIGANDEQEGTLQAMYMPPGSLAPSLKG